MAFTRPRAAQIDFDVTNISDPLIRLNSAETGSADKDVGIVIERGDDTNTAIIYDESANEFAVINTTETGTTSGNVTIASYADIRAGTFYGDGSGLTGVTSYTDSDVASYLSANGYDTSTNIISSITDSAPATLDTLNELAAALGDDANFATTTATSLGEKLVKASNLSDLTDAATARTNLGLGTAATTAATAYATAAQGTLAASATQPGDNVSTLTNDSGYITASTTDTLTNKTLTSPQVNTNIDLLAQADLRFYDSDDSNYVGFQAPATASGNILWTLPGSDGSANQVLATDGSGTLSFVDQSGGGAGADPDIELDSAVGDNSTTDFSVTTAPISAEDLLVTINGIVQRPTTDYTVSGTTVTFGTAPFTGAVVAARTITASAVGPEVSADTTPQLGGDLDTNGNDITFGDNDKAIFGAGSDLQIYHGGSASDIKETGTGNLRIWGDDIQFFNSAGSKYHAQMITDGAVTLYYNGAEKLSTTATGVDVTGTVTADELTVDTSDQVIINHSADGGGIRIDSTNGTNTGSLRFGDVADNYIGAVEYNHSTDALSFYANNATRMTIDSSGNVGMGASSPSSTFRASIYGDGSSVIGGVEFRNAAAGGSTFTIGHATATSPSATLNVVGAGNLIMKTSNTERLRIDSSGNLLVGTTSATFNGGGRGLIELNGSSDSLFSLKHGDTAGLYLYTASGEGRVAQSQNLPMTFFTNNTERMRINAGGNLLVGTTGSLVASARVRASATGAAFEAEITDAAGYGAAFWANRTASNGWIAAWYRGGTSVGSISVTASSTSYNTSSDYRLKENVVADWDATTRLKQLNPVRFNFIADADNTVDGFLAHEVQSVVPEAITGTHDGMRDEEYEVSAATGDIYTPAIDAVLDEDGNEVTPAVAEVIHSTDVEQPEELAEGQQWRETTAAVMGTRSVPDYQGIDQSKLVPLLVKTIQELEARITALETAE